MSQKNGDAHHPAAQCQRQRHALFPHPVDHGECDALDRTGVFECFGHDAAEHNHNCDSLKSPAEPRLERSDVRLAIETGQQSEQQDGQHQRNEDVPPELRDRQEQQRDHADQARQCNQRTIRDLIHLVARFRIPAAFERGCIPIRTLRLLEIALL